MAPVRADVGARHVLRLDEGWKRDKSLGGTKKIEGAAAFRPVRPLSIVPLSFLRFPAQSGSKHRFCFSHWQATFERSLVERCALLCKMPQLDIGKSKTEEMRAPCGPALGADPRPISRKLSEAMARTFIQQPGRLGSGLIGPPPRRPEYRQGGSPRCRTIQQQS